jgi:hypothetical protein
LNRYAYARNNPLTFRDPSGLYMVPGCGNCWGSGDPGTGSADAGFFTDGGLSIFDTVSTYAGTYTYDGDTWDDLMSDGYGGGVSGGPNGSLVSSDGEFLGSTWQSLLFIGTVTPSSVAEGYVSVGASSKQPTELDTYLQNYKACLSIGLQTVADDLNPIGPPTLLGAAQDLTTTMAQGALGAAAAHSLESGLTVPLRSSIVRGLLSNWEVLGAAADALVVAAIPAALAHGVYAEATGCF